MKSLLHICALGALRGNGEFKGYFDRKVTEGKPKMAIINAIRNKIILRVFACLNENRLYAKDYMINPKLQQTGITKILKLETYELK